MDPEIYRQQQAEITEHHLYKKLARIAKEEHNKKILGKISEDELGHYNYWKKFTGKDMKPKKLKIWWYVFLARIFGLAFSLRLMESGEEGAQEFYKSLEKEYPSVKRIRKDEKEHEDKLIGMLEDVRLNYAGSIVLGLNDALVELTGTLAGLSFAFANTTIIGVTGLIMGVAASLSMAASGYLSSREMEGNGERPIVSAIYTGVAYIFAVILLVGPYLIFDEVYTALGVMLGMTILIIAAYTFYITVAKKLSFWKRFGEMAAISLGVALISFGIGIALKTFIGIDI